MLQAKKYVKFVKSCICIQEIIKIVIYIAETYKFHDYLFKIE